MNEAPRQAALRVRDLTVEDLAAVVRIDALHTGEEKPDYWRRVMRDFLDTASGSKRIGLAAEDRGQLIGYLLGEVRAFEFGSDACGWIFAAGVEPDRLRHGVASTLLRESCERFRILGVAKVRTMVRRNSVDVLSFFRANGFVGGSFVQLELDLEEQR
jgi:ribosomal protein S18 acetylase RimI-like enzyme